MAPIIKAIDPLTGGQLVAEYGAEPLTYYGGSFLNRLSFLRDDYKFLHSAITHPSTQFLVLQNLAPPVEELKETGVKASKEEIAAALAANLPRNPLHRLRFLTLGENPALAEFIGTPYKIDEHTQISAWYSKRDAIGMTAKPLIVFLGLDENADPAHSLGYQNSNKGGAHAGESYQGQAYFAVDLTPEYMVSEDLKKGAQAVLDAAKELQNASFQITPFGVRLSRGEAGVYAQARMYIDWNTRNRFCGGCGLPNMSINGGCKLVCPAQDNGIDLPACATRGRVSNLSFPRTDNSIIAAVVNYAGDKILLGRNRRFPKGFFSCLAGFLEPAETIEDCVRREIWEEAGVDVGRVIIHSSQPWPFPANIMLGCIAQVRDSSEKAHTIHLGHDPELEEANWYSLKDLKEVLGFAAEGYLGSRPEGLPEGAPQLPQPEAIAYTLIEAVVNGRIRGLNNKESSI